MSVENTQPTFFQHLAELRKRLIRSVIAYGIAFAVCLFFSKTLYEYLALPLKEVLPETSFFIATHPLEAWLTYLKTALLSGFFLASPVFFYNLWSFISPGLYKDEKKYTLSFVFFSSVLFIAGALFGYMVVFPFGFEYFSTLVDGTGIQFLPRMQDYFSFAWKLLLSFGLIFELPLFIFFLVISNLVPIKSLIAFQKYIFVVALVVSALLTPPDIITQVFLSIPLVLLYEVGLVLGLLVRKKSSKKTAATQE